MALKNPRNKSVDVHKFAMTPKADIPRSSFDRQSTHKTTFNSGDLVPVYVDEVLPGDTFNFHMTAFARMATPIYPIMDNLKMESFFFFVPNRLVWDNWQKFMGEQTDPGDSIDFSIPQQVSPVGGYAIGSLQDYMGLPTVGQVEAASTVSHNALFARAYNLIYNEWFRDENLQDSLVVDRDDGPDTITDYTLKKRGKRHDYFTSCLPWPQKGEAVTLPLGDRAPISGLGLIPTGTATAGPTNFKDSTTDAAGEPYANFTGSGAQTFYMRTDGTSASQVPDIYADLSEATASTINQLRQSFQIQKLLERDARGGTRYTEIIRAHFGVISPDARLQRPEYLGGGSTNVNINPIAQTSATGASGSSTPLGELSALGTLHSTNNGFTQSFTEHGMVIGLVNIRADLTYQQGLRKMWSRNTRYDYYFPEFAMLGEQGVLNKEIYVTGEAADDDVFGYQERWAEYRYLQSQISGLFRSTAPGTIDGWHLAQNFGTRPTLNDTFITEDVPMSRILAVGAAADVQEFIFDSFIQVKSTRPLPMYSVPGLIDHF